MAVVHGLLHIVPLPCMLRAPPVSECACRPTARALASTAARVEEWPAGEGDGARAMQTTCPSFVACGPGGSNSGVRVALAWELR